MPMNPIWDFFISSNISILVWSIFSRGFGEREASKLDISSQCPNNEDCVNCVDEKPYEISAVTYSHFNNVTSFNT